MQPSTKAHSLLGVFFAVALVGGAMFNLYIEGSRLEDGLATIPAPVSLASAREAGGRVTALVENHLVGKHTAWAAHAWIQQRLGKSEMNGFSVIRASDGKLYRGGLFPLRTGRAEALAEDLAVFAESANESGARFLYLGTPDTVLIGAKHLPEGMPYNDYNPVLDSFLFELREKDVAFLDSRYAFLAHGVSPDGILANTSFIPGGKAAFALFTCLVDGLERRFSLALDPDGFHRNPENYEFDTRKDFFIGQLGKETGPAFSGLDDFTAVKPAFETDFAIETIDMFGAVGTAEGDIEETLLHPDALVYYEDLYSLYPEGYYVHANAAWSKVVNKRNPEGMKVLVIHDFQTAQLIGHLAPLFSEIHTLSLNPNRPMNAADYLRDHDFDLVLVTFFPQNLLFPETRELIGVDKRKEE